MPPEITQPSEDFYREIIKTITPETVWKFSTPDLVQISKTAKKDKNYRITELAERMILKRKPNDAEALIALAISLEHQEKYAEARDHRLIVKIIKPTDQENLIRIEFLKIKIAASNQRPGRPTIYEKLCKADLTTCSAAQLEYAIKEAASMGDSPNLLRFTEEQIRQYPGSALGYSYKAIALEKLGKHQEAMDIRISATPMLVTDRSQKINKSAINRLAKKVRDAAATAGQVDI